MTSDGPLILVADDSPTVTGILGFLFSEQGWRVTTAADGVEAVLRFYEAPPDLVVLDIEMPRMDGYQVCRLLKEDPEAKRVPVVILTSRDMQSDRFRGLSAGADAYVVKDLEDDNLLVTIRDRLSAQTATSPIPPRRVSEGEILRTVNRMLDQRLFIMTVTGELERLGAKVADFEDLIQQVVQLYSRVFEFVVGGVCIRDGDAPAHYLVSDLEAGSAVLDDLSRWLVSEAGLTGEPSSIRIFPHERTPRLADGDPAYRMAWPIASHGKTIGAFGMASTSPLKFESEGRYLHEQFLARAAIVIQNALLMKQLGERNQALANALAKLKEAQSQLVQSEKMASLGQMLAGLVHEINNPLNFIAGNIEILDESYGGMLKLIDAQAVSQDNAEREAGALTYGEVDLEFIREDLPSLIADVREGVVRARQIVQDLWTFTAQDRGDEQLSDLATILHSTVNVLRHRWEPVAEVKESYAALPTYLCNSGQIGQTALNLLTNAIQAVIDRPKSVATGKGRIEVGLKHEGDFVLIEVSDDGIGIPEENLGLVFEPFFTTRDVGSGMGLGLSIAHGIVARHDGRIGIVSQPGKGTTVRITLPASRLTQDHTV
ncbi:MAG: response regulator [Calditrichaeota bacterium]|nr:response regulator [Calditrichota bacterium]